MQTRTPYFAGLPNESSTLSGPSFPRSASPFSIAARIAPPRRGTTRRLPGVPVALLGDKHAGRPSGGQGESTERRRKGREEGGRQGRCGGRREEVRRVSSAGRTCPPRRGGPAGRCTAGATLGSLGATSLGGGHCLRTFAREILLPGSLGHQEEYKTVPATSTYVHYLVNTRNMVLFFFLFFTWTLAFTRLAAPRKGLHSCRPLSGS